MFDCLALSTLVDTCAPCLLCLSTLVDTCVSCLLCLSTLVDTCVSCLLCLSTFVDTARVLLLWFCPLLWTLASVRLLCFVHFCGHRSLHADIRKARGFNFIRDYTILAYYFEKMGRSARSLSKNSNIPEFYN